MVSSDSVKDNRGTLGHHKTVHGTVKTVLNDIMMKLPKYDSHYHDTHCSDNNDVFLAPHLTLNTIYDLLVEEIGLNDGLTDVDIPSIQWFHSVLQKYYYVMWWCSGNTLAPRS